VCSASVWIWPAGTEGTNKTFGVHAAGVVIFAEPLAELGRLRRPTTTGQVITQLLHWKTWRLDGAAEMDFPRVCATSP